MEGHYAGWPVSMAQPALGEHAQNSNKTTLLTAPSAASPARDAANSEMKLCFLSI